MISVEDRSKQGWAENFKSKPVAIENSNHGCGPFESLREAMQNLKECAYYGFQGGGDGSRPIDHCHICLSSHVVDKITRLSTRFPYLRICPETKGWILDPNIKIIGY